MKLRIAAIAMCLLVGVTFAASHLRRDRQTNSQYPSRTQTSELPSPVQEGTLSERQKQHSKLFGGYQDVTQGKTLRALVLEKGDTQVGRLIGNIILPASFNINQYFEKLSCEADVVLIGTVRDKSSNLVEDGTFTFTEYSFIPDDVLKDNPLQHVQPNSEITIVRAGGTVRLLGHVISAIDSSEKPLTVGGRYLLFLKFVSSTGAYRSASNSLADNAFKLEGTQITQASDLPLPIGARRSADLSPFLIDVRRALSSGCAR